MKKQLDKKYQIIIIAAAVLVLAVYVAIMLNNYGVISFERIFKKQYDLSFSMGEHGTAGIAEGNTVLVSVFVTADGMAWDETEDAELIEQQRENIAVAAEWLTEQAELYGKEFTFVYDWEEDAQLRYYAELKRSMLYIGGNINDGYNYLWDYINNEIPSQQLVDRYEAANIVYLVFYNTDNGNCIPPFTEDTNFSPESSYDIVMLPTVYSEGIQHLSPPVIAHEILHTFGAPDLYRTGTYVNQYGMNSEFMQYCEENYANEIMLHTYDKEQLMMYFGYIPMEITEVTAYYIGWLDEMPEILDEYGLHYSQHDPQRPSLTEGR